MKIFQTNAALGYKQLAYILRVGDEDCGYKYLCIGTNNIIDSSVYKTGEIVEDLEKFCLEETSYKITDSELYGTYLFDYFLLHYDNKCVHPYRSIIRNQNGLYCKKCNKQISNDPNIY